LPANGAALMTQIMSARAFVALDTWVIGAPLPNAILGSAYSADDEIWVEEGVADSVKTLTAGLSGASPQ